MIQQYENEQRRELVDIFAACPYDRVLIDSVLEGHFGTAHAIVVDEQVIAARLDSGAFTMVAGDADAAQLDQLLAAKTVFIVTPQNASWDARLKAAYPDRAQEIPFIQFRSDEIKIDHLKAIVQAVPEGFEIRSFDKALAQQAINDLNNEYLFENFTSIDDFLERGIGYCIVHNDQVVCAATSMAKSRTAIDIEIQTHADYRRRGLATIAGAQLVLSCLEQDIEPMWLAANPESEKLASKLGYVKTGMYRSLFIPSEDV